MFSVTSSEEKQKRGVGVERREHHARTRQDVARNLVPDADAVPEPDGEHHDGERQHPFADALQPRRADAPRLLRVERDSVPAWAQWPSSRSLRPSVLIAPTSTSDVSPAERRIFGRGAERLVARIGGVDRDLARRPGPAAPP